MANNNNKNKNKNVVSVKPIMDADIDHFNLDGIYELAMIISLLLAGIAGAADKCDKYKGNPLCVPPGERIVRKSQPSAPVVLKGGALDDETTQEVTNLVNSLLTEQRSKETPARLAQKVIEQVAENVTPGASAKSAFFGKFMNLVRTVNGKIFNVVGNASKKVMSIFGFQGNLSNEDMEKSIKNFLVQNKELIKKMTRDPEVQQALREWMEEVGVINIQLIDMAKPTIDRIVNKSLQTLNNVATTASKGIIVTSMNVLEGVIGEIPVAGGIIAIIMAFIRGFNTAMLAAAPGVEFSSEAFFTAVKTAFSTVNIFKNAGSALRQASANVKGAVENLAADAQGPVPAPVLAPVLAPVPSKEDLALLEQAGKQTGEEYIKNAEKEASDEKEGAVKEDEAAAEGEAVKGGRANIRRRIKHVTRRLQNTLNSFRNNKSRKNIDKKIKNMRKIN
jgi:uncharacterized protein YjgD (DUF1641 family)